MPVVSNTITKIVVRRGARVTGKTVILNTAEPGWYTDTKRLYIGDNVTVGGVPAGVKNYLIKDFSTLNFLTLSGAEPGDFVYDDYSNLLYFLTGGAGVNPGSAQSNWVAIDFVVKVDNNSVEFNTTSALQIKNIGVQAKHINTNIVGTGLVGGAGTAISLNPDNITIDIDNNRVRLKPGAVPISYLGSIAPFTILGNTNSFSAPIEQIEITNGTVLGKFGGVLGPIDFETIVAYGKGIGNINTTNGLQGSITIGAPSTININYDPDIIDVTSPGSIQLKRDTTITGNGQVTGLLRVQGDIIAFYTSDERAKTNIKQIENSLYKLDSINGVEFDWKKDGTHDIGVIAQEVQKVLPEATSLRSDGYLGVNYDKIVPLLINSIKELKKEVEDLKNEIRKV